MKYLEFTFRTSPCTEVVNDVLSAILGDAGFESFVEQEGGIAAYIQKDLYDETTVKAAIDEFPLPDTQIEYTFTEAEDKDWNEEWEKNFFQPIVIGDRCVIHSTFHHATAEQGSAAKNRLIDATETVEGPTLAVLRIIGNLHQRASIHIRINQFLIVEGIVLGAIRE